MSFWKMFFAFCVFALVLGPVVLAEQTDQGTGGSVEVQPLTQKDKVQDKALSPRFWEFVAVVGALCVLAVLIRGGETLYRRKRRAKQAFSWDVAAQALGLTHQANGPIPRPMLPFCALDREPRWPANNVVAGALGAHRVYAVHNQTLWKGRRDVISSERNRYYFGLEHGLVLPALFISPFQQDADRMPEMLGAALTLTGEGRAARDLPVVDFPERPEFARMFKVRSGNEDFARLVCCPDVTEYLMTNSNLSLAIAGNVLALRFADCENSNHPIPAATASDLMPEELGARLQQLMDIWQRIPKEASSFQETDRSVSAAKAAEELQAAVALAAKERFLKGFIQVCFVSLAGGALALFAGAWLLRDLVLRFGFGSPLHFAVTLALAVFHFYGLWKLWQGSSIVLRPQIKRDFPGHEGVGAVVLGIGLLPLLLFPIKALIPGDGLCDAYAEGAHGIIEHMSDYCYYAFFGGFFSILVLFLAIRIAMGVASELEKTRK